jgi:hypothetical protein
MPRKNRRDTKANASKLQRELDATIFLPQVLDAELETWHSGSTVAHAGRRAAECH